jgi:hypothetical protein
VAFLQYRDSGLTSFLDDLMLIFASPGPEFRSSRFFAALPCSEVICQIFAGIEKVENITGPEARGGSSLQQTKAKKEGSRLPRSELSPYTQPWFARSTERRTLFSRRDHDPRTEPTKLPWSHRHVSKDCLSIGSGG